MKAGMFVTLEWESAHEDPNRLPIWIGGTVDDAGKRAARIGRVVAGL